MNGSRDLVSYFEKDIRVSIAFPPTWDYGSNADFKLIVMALSKNGYRTNIGVSVHKTEIDSADDFRVYIAQANANLQGEYHQYKKINELDCWIDGRPAYHQHYQWCSEEHKLAFDQTLTLIIDPTGALYEVIGTCLSLDAKEGVPVLEGVIEGIRIIL